MLKFFSTKLRWWNYPQILIWSNACLIHWHACFVYGSLSVKRIKNHPYRNDSENRCKIMQGCKKGDKISKWQTLNWNTVIQYPYSRRREERLIYIYTAFYACSDVIWIDNEQIGERINGKNRWLSIFLTRMGKTQFDTYIYDKIMERWNVIPYQ